MEYVVIKLIGADASTIEDKINSQCRRGYRLHTAMQESVVTILIFEKLK